MNITQLQSLSPIEQQALTAIQQALPNYVALEKLVLFGSVVRGQATAESDIDLLIITKHPFSRTERHKITGLVCDVNLDYDTNFSTTVVDHDSWYYGFVSHSYFRQEVEREGVVVA